MKTVLVHMEDCPELTSVLASALLIARRFGSHIEALHVPQGLPSMLPLSPEGGLATADVMASLERGAEDASQRLRVQFDQFVRTENIVQMPMGAATENTSASWHEIELPDQETLASRGRAFSLIVVGRPVTGRFAPSMVALEGALFESGRPLLIAPPKPPKEIGRIISVAWNGSTETARTLGLAMPLLYQADEVVVVTVEEGMVPGPSGREIAQHLVRAGIAARTRNVRCEGRAVGDAMLAESKAAGADLVVKGAYTQSRFRQMIFGGATSHILAHADLPVFMAH